MSLNHLAWALYIVGTALVALSWFNLVSPGVGWTGWLVGMTGWGLQFVGRKKRDDGSTAEEGGSTASREDGH